MLKISQKQLNELKQKAADSPRRRAMHNIHQTNEDTIHRMLNCLQRDTYVQPHTHENPDKREMFVIISGKAVVVQFSDTGEITDSCILEKDSEYQIIEFPARVMHTVIALVNGTILLEVKDGPWKPTDDKKFASWAPAEGHPECNEYNDMILTKLGII